MTGMTEVMLALGRSEAMFEGESAAMYPQPIPDDVPGGVVELGPFEYVELTYELLRVGPEGEPIGYFKDGLWWLNDDLYPFSDLDVFAVKGGDRALDTL